MEYRVVSFAPAPPSSGLPSSVPSSGRELLRTGNPSNAYWAALGMACLQAQGVLRKGVADPQDERHLEGVLGRVGMEGYGDSAVLGMLNEVFRKRGMAEYVVVGEDVGSSR